MISFIVPAYNEAQCLPATLAALHAAGQALGEPYEIVVADDASTDATAALAQQQGAVLVSVANRQIAATRNAGARAARGDWLIFVDADTLVNEAVVRAAVQAMRSGAVGGGAGMRFDEPAPAYARWLLRGVVRLFRATGYAAGCFLFCTRTAFVAVGGFDERYYGAEELVMSRALKRQGRFVVLKEAVITSARKLRTYSARETLQLLAGLARRGPQAVKQRAGMAFWYERRDDPRKDA
ncbi:MAG: glycosyltransferase [Hylemonella sp.]|uniref:glycosyltransferase n=1 Tax=Hylemonella sp. TaxID=2066020 RepID=UPI0022C853F5|nr:glycosyltransferase [Hylemonella sp.]MCZ8253228.1 glycosyltransferase [Hylemonella sp.]